MDTIVSAAAAAASTAELTSFLVQTPVIIHPSMTMHAHVCGFTPVCLLGFANNHDSYKFNTSFQQSH